MGEAQGFKTPKKMDQAVVEKVSPERRPSSILRQHKREGLAWACSGQCAVLTYLGPLGGGTVVEDKQALKMPLNETIIFAFPPQAGETVGGCGEATGC